ncbi:polysaccharide biosynthesis/export family protein [Catenovulum sp. SM1970]|nr:XrtA/PEP-CTERM system exopolysaccharide export protein [Marinifaba aquimaris]NTS75958.1 polysaccharide biosynthesis/export family protein [Marinifaba aquimaris]
MGALTLALSLSGCSSHPTLPTATIQPSATTQVDDYNYLIGPNDTLEVFVWRNPEISGSFIVRPDGKILTPLVEEIDVAGLKPSQVAERITKELANYVREPKVTVSVTNFNGPFSEQVRVIGEASTPKAINYSEHMTLLDLVIQVGGLTEYADGNDAVLIRIQDGKRVEYALRVDDLVKDGDISANVDILPGDIVIIPEAWF